MNNTLRIIAGRWKGRKLSFNSYGNMVRPTPDRIRETLFNWLQPNIKQAHCLDLYAGSGVLALEALSRGAASVAAVDQHPGVCAVLRSTAAMLQATTCNVWCQDVWTWLQAATNIIGKPMDLIFVDPPYASGLLLQTLQLLQQYNWVGVGTIIYFEHNQAVLLEQLPVGWQLLHAKQAGQAYYYLAVVASN